MAALAGVAAAVALLATPVGLLEMLVASSGLSEAVPAAAPPLGVTARLMMAGFVGLLIAGAFAAIRDPRQAEDERDTAATFYSVKELASGRDPDGVTCSLPPDRHRVPRLTESWFC